MYIIIFIFVLFSQAKTSQKEESSVCFNLNDPKNYQLNSSILVIKGIGKMCHCQKNDTFLFNPTIVTEIQLSENIISIGNTCFRQFTNINTIEWNEEIETIGKGAFYGTSINELQFPSSLKSIESRAFENCFKLKNIIFEPNSTLTVIEDYVFKSCTSLISLQLPSSLKTINFNKVFEGCGNLTQIEIKEDNNDGYFYFNENQIYSEYNKTLEFILHKNSIDHIQIKKDIEILGKSVLEGIQMKIISLPTSLKIISESSLSHNYQLRSIVIPENVELIETLSFAFNRELTTVFITSQNITIQRDAFFGCKKLTNVIFTGKIINLDDKAFNGCDKMPEIKNVEFYESFSTLFSIEYESSYSDSSSESLFDESIDNSNHHTNSDNKLNELDNESNSYEDESNESVCLKSGECGKDCQFIFDMENEQLHIFGGSVIEHFGVIPKEEQKYIKEIVIEEGIKTILPNAFKDLSIYSIEYNGISEIECTEEIFNNTNIYGIKVNSNYEQTLFCNKSVTNIYSELNETIKWMIYENVLIIYGEGNIPNFGYFHQQVYWNEYKNIIKEIDIKEGILSIGNNAFYQLNNVQTVSIPSTVENIGNGVFIGCSSIQQIKVNDKNMKYSVNDNVLFDKKETILIYYPNGLDSIIYTIPSSVNIIGQNAFHSNEYLQFIDLQEGIETIEENAFFNCKELRTLTLPTTIEMIDSYAFFESNKLRMVIYRGSDEIECGKHVFNPIENRLFESITVINDYQNETICDIDVNEKIEYFGEENVSTKWFISISNELIIYGVCSMKNYDDKNCIQSWKQYISSIYAIIIDDDIISIGNSEFKSHNNLNTIKISSTIKSIGNNAFANCTSLKSVSLTKTIDSIGKYLFKDCTSLESVILSTSLTTIPSYTFSGCISLKSISIPSNVLTIKEYSFENSGLTTITIPTTVTTINSKAFVSSKNLKTINYSGNSQPSSCSSDAFSSIGTSYAEVPISYTQASFCGLTPRTVGSCGSSQTACKYDYNHNSKKLTISGNGGMNSYSTTNMPWYNKRSAITSITIGNGITSIGNNAFYDCTKIGSFTIPSSVKTIGSQAFYNCDSIPSITIPTTISTINSKAFSNSGGIKTINYSGNSQPSSCSSDAFSSIGTSYAEVPIGYTQASFCGLTPRTIGSCGSSQTACKYDYNHNSKKLTISGNGGMNSYSTTNMPWYNKRSTITSISISGITSIGNYAFYGCSGFSSTTVPNSVKTIGNTAFESCTKMSSITIGSGVSSIGTNPFIGCSSLNTVTFNSNSNFKFSDKMIITSNGKEIVTYLETKTTSLLVLSSYSTIRPYSIYNNKHLKTLILHSSISSIGNYGIAKCSSLKNVYHLHTSKPSSTGSGILNSCGINIMFVKTSYSGSISGVNIKKAHGTLGSNVFYHFESNHLLVYGTGGMYDYNWVKSENSDCPMNSNRLNVRTMKIEYGVTSVGNYAFYYYHNMHSLEIESTLSYIGLNSFRNSVSLSSIIYYGSSAPNYYNNADSCPDGCQFCNYDKGACNWLSTTVKVPKNYNSNTFTKLNVNKAL